MDKLLLGRYIQGDSLVHRLDPRVKMILCFYFVLIIFLCNNWQSYLLLGIVTLLSVLLSKIDLSYFVKGVMPLIWLILFTVLLQVFYTWRPDLLAVWPVDFDTVWLSQWFLCLLSFCVDHFYVDSFDCDNDTTCDRGCN